ncbi:MAG: TATA-binding related factor of subunit 20 of mediator complex-domain-containing protein [Benniella sp.]|nr:MAG: TATA-binding related factor of subunit 20 of mediator complex-domain-containing protein [Benniella sp.]
MGATCLVHWKDANGQQSLTLLSDRLLKQFHASSIARWTINWKVFRDTGLSKSGPGKMMHVVHVQGGATARGVPTGSQAAILSSGGVFTGGGTTVGGVAATPGGSGLPGGTGMNVGTGIGGPSKAGLGMLPSGSGPSGSGVGGPTGGVGGSGVAQAAEALNSTAWCLIDDGALGMPSTPATSTTPSTTTPVAESAAPRKRAVLVEVERDIEALILKLKSLWVQRQHAVVEGQVYDLGDFIVRAGNILVANSTYKGMLIEIEYLPQTTNATASNAILEEFVKLISPPGVTLYSPQMLDYPYEQVGLDATKWSTLHSGFQYMTLFRRQHIL